MKPSGRRKGIASQIICWCAARARRRGAARLWLHAARLGEAPGGEGGGMGVAGELGASKSKRLATEVTSLTFSSFRVPLKPQLPQC